IEGGTINLDVSPGVGGANLAVTLNNNATVNLPSSQLASLTLHGSSRLNLSGTAALLQLGALSADGSAKLDLADNELILKGASDIERAKIANLVRTGRNGGQTSWTNPGINSSAAANDPTGNHGLMFRTEGDNIHIKYTFNGDFDLNEQIDADDYFVIDRGFAE